MHGFVHSQALDVREVECPRSALRHLFGIVEALERDVLGASTVGFTA